MVNAKTFLEKRFDAGKQTNFRYQPTMELEDAVHTALLTLKEGMDGLLSENVIEVGISRLVKTKDRDGNDIEKEEFRVLSGEEVKDYLENIA
jgi:20S proteasome subunit alpha 2